MQIDRFTVSASALRIKIDRFNDFVFVDLLEGSKPTDRMLSICLPLDHADRYARACAAFNAVMDEATTKTEAA